MTNAGPIILIIISIGIGYVLEPIFIADAKTTTEKEVEASDDSADEQVDIPAPIPAPEVQVDLTKITSEDFPEKVSLKVPLTITDPSGITMSLKKGNEVKPLRLEGDQLVVQPVGFPVEGKLHVDQTDFKKHAVVMMEKRMAKQDTVAKSDPAPKPDPAPPAATTPDSQPEPEPAKNKLDESAIIAAMKASVANVKVTEFQAAQVTKWKAGKEMKFDGEVYQTGLVSFKAETILGVQEHDAIALIKDGSVLKWMWAKTKLEMR